MALIELRGVSRVYQSRREPPVHALAGIDLVINEGEFVAIVGPSGGGKTTLMNILGMLDVPTGGEYLMDGELVSESDSRRLATLRSQNIGFVFQAFHLLPGRPAYDSVELNLLYRGVQRDERRRASLRALEAVGLGDHSRQDTSTLSGGQRQRVAIARAVAGDARLVLADEPTGNLDSVNAELVLQELVRLGSSGATVIVVTHSAEVAALARRTIRIADGRVVSDSVASPDVPLLTAGTEPDAAYDLPAISSTDAPVEQLRHRHDKAARNSKLRVVDLLRDAWASVTSRPMQTTGQAVAVAVAVALVIITLGLSASARSQVAATFDAHLNREVTAQWAGATPHAPLLSSVPDAIADVAGVQSAAVLIDLNPSIVKTFAESRTVRPHIAVGDLETAARVDVQFASWHRGDLVEGEAIVGDLLASDLQLASISAAPTIQIDGKRYQVVGLIIASSRLPLLRGEIIIGPPQDLDARPSADGNLLISTDPGAAQQVARQVPLVVNPYQPESVRVSAPTDPTQLRGQIEQGVQITLTAFTLLAVAVAVAALMNATLLAVNARRGEIGMRKAVGARDRHIGELVTVESAYVGVIGGVVGLFLGMVVILAVTISQRWTPVFDISLLPLAIASGVLIGATGGGIAALRAARIRPADNLRA
ncbi:ATP-binding cassette domain-containing protein [Microbacterium sp. ZW T5_56]|uniref:ABC transporter ATP-binding protein/permease n=1 Tax=Microbacterium sp. ZW T5_56 TaxID=3378081 RepID=UPI003853B870